MPPDIDPRTIELRARQNRERNRTVDDSFHAHPELDVEDVLTGEARAEWDRVIGAVYARHREQGRALAELIEAEKAARASA